MTFGKWGAWQTPASLELPIDDLEIVLCFKKCSNVPLIKLQTAFIGQIEFYSSLPHSFIEHKSTLSTVSSFSDTFKLQSAPFLQKS